jgi:hypothetical protein
MYPALLGCPFVPIAWHICVEFISYSLPIMFSFLVVLPCIRSTECFNQELISRILSSSLQLMRSPLLPSSLLPLDSTTWTASFCFCDVGHGEADSDPWEEVLARIPNEGLCCIPPYDLLAANLNTWLGECTGFSWIWTPWKLAAVVCLQFPWFWGPWNICGWLYGG